MREWLLKSGDYEEVLHKVRRAGLGIRPQIEAALTHVFTVHDRIISRNQETINNFQFQEFMGSVAQQSDDDRAFVFTLNQDLLLERKLSPYNYPVPVHVGIEAHPDWYQLNMPEFSEAHLRVVPSCVGPLGIDNLRSGTHYVKLHGSFDWRSEPGEQILITGREKLGDIGRFPILVQYQKLFEEVMSMPELDILVIGYSFGDDHVNAKLLLATEGLARFFVVNTEPMEQWTARMINRNLGRLPNRTYGYWSSPLSEIFPSGRSRQDRSEIYKTIRHSFVESRAS